MYTRRNSRRVGRAGHNRSRTLSLGAQSSLPRQEAIEIALAAHRVIGAMSPLGRLKAGPSLLQFFDEHAEEFGFIDFDFEMLGDPSEANSPALLALLEWHIEQSKLRRRTTSLDTRIEWLRKTAGLSKFEADLLKLGVRTTMFEPWAKFQETIDNGSSYFRPQFAAHVLGCSVARARNALRRNCALMRTGLLDDQRDDDYTISRIVIDLMRMRAAGPSQLEAALLYPAPPSTLAWDDYAHLVERDLACNLVQAAVSKREGINILLHGAPGTGKSEFARALANRLNLSPVFIGEADEEGGEPTRAERLAHLSMVRALTPVGAPRLIVIDEADDLMFPGFSSQRQNNSKLWLNQLVESSVTPTVWIVNDAAVLGAPVIRRMELAAKFDLPPKSVRTRVVKHHAAKIGLFISELDAEKLGALTVSPAVTANALKAARLAGGGTSTAILSARSVQRAMGDRQRIVLPQSTNFDPAISRTSVDLVELTSRLSTSGQRRWSMLLSGPPGTGKSAYARHVAATCELEVIEKKGSDLLSMFVGGTEQAIARAFEEAADAGAMLILDEADSMLRDRRSADRGWEVSMVNEMLSWMEQHPMPFVATTNLSDNLDGATSRRFLFKLRFEYLDPIRSRRLFERVFEIAPPHSSVELPDELTPADFDVVARRAALLEVKCRADLVEMLRGEVEARSHQTNRAVGFAVNGK